MPLTDLRVLIVEDQPILALDLAIAFQEQGAKPLCAVSEAHALSAVRSGQVDAAVLDLSLWNDVAADGIAEILSEHGVPFVVFSAYSRKLPAAIAHVRKPGSPTLVIEALANHFRTSS